MLSKKIIYISILFCSIAGNALSQVAVNANSLVKVNGAFATNTSFRNSSSAADFSAMELFLVGTAQSLITSSPIVTAAITIDNGGTKTFSGDWEITDSFSLINGIADVPDGAKLLYSGTAAVEGNDNSFVKGYFHVSGTGRKFFPIGQDLGYAPAVLENFTGTTIGLRAVLGDVAFTLPADVISYFSGHYWESDVAPLSPVSLSINGAGDFLAASQGVILQSETSGTATALTSSLSSEFITSDDNAINTRLGIGKQAEFGIVIHDLITPFTLDEKNDKLFIENIDLTEKNNVRLIDRWGLVAAEWSNFSNDVEYDFSSLSPGNYVCLVDFSYPGESSTTTVKGVVTVLKTK